MIQKKEEIAMNFDKEKMVRESLTTVFGPEVFEEPQTSPFTFPHGGQYQIELVGPYSPASFEELLNAAQKAELPVHRVVGTIPGFAGLSDADLKAFANISASSGVEFIGTPISPLTNVEGVKEKKHPCEWSFCGVHLRGTDTVYQYLYQMLRGIEQGLRTFLIWDIGALDCAEYMKSEGELPGGVSFKVSVFAGSAHSRDCEIWGWRRDIFGLRMSFSSISSLNPVALPAHEFAQIRRNLGKFVPLDVHVTTFDKMLGLDRRIEMPDIIRWASPVNAKFERGDSVNDCGDENLLRSSVIPKEIQSAKRFVEYLEEYHKDIRMEPVVK